MHSIIVQIKIQFHLPYTAYTHDVAWYSNNSIYTPSFISHHSSHLSLSTMVIILTPTLNINIIIYITTTHISSHLLLITALLLSY